MWQLSSLLQQVAYNGTDVPDLKIRCSVHKDDPYADWFDILYSLFGDKLDFKWDMWEDNAKFARRGWVRNEWLHKADTDWLIFNDGDMVYDPRFFAHLSSWLPEHKGKTAVVGTARYTMPIEDGYKLVAAESYDKPIADAAAKCKVVSPTLSNGGHICGAGFFQCVDTKAVQALNINYVEGRHDTSVFGGTYKTVSDKVFRYKVGGYLKLRQAMPSYHLNHYRKNDPQLDPNRPALH